MNIRPVELVGVEGIGASQLAQSSKSSQLERSIFVHAKLGINRAEIILRGSDDKWVKLKAVKNSNLC